MSSYMLFLLLQLTLCTHVVYSHSLSTDQNDYSSQECGRNFSLHRTRRRTTQVVVTLGSDNIVEGTEFLSLELQLTSPTQQSAVNDAGNIFFQNISTITVNDRTGN